MKRPRQRWRWLRVEQVLGEYGIPQDSAAGRRHLEVQMEQRRVAKAGVDYKGLQRGWSLDRKSLRKELLGQMNARMGAEHSGEARQETMEEHAGGIVAQEMKQRGWDEKELERRAKGDAQ